MKNVFLFLAVIIMFISCDEKEYQKTPGSSLFEEILPAGRVDTTLIRFIFENEGNSKITGKVACSKDVMKSSGEFYKYSYKPLIYFMQKSPTLLNKTVIYFQADSLTSDTFRIKISFPDTTQIIGTTSKTVKDTLVYKALKKSLATTSF